MASTETDIKTSKETKIEQLIDAFKNGEIHQIDSLISDQVTIFDEFRTKCVPGCDCINTFSAYLCLKHGFAHNSVLLHLINSKYISDDKLLEILDHSLTFSGGFSSDSSEIDNKKNMVDQLFTYFLATDPAKLKNYQDEYGQSLFHLMYHGYVDSSVIHEWSKRLVDNNCCDPLAKTRPDEYSVDFDLPELLSSTKSKPSQSATILNVAVYHCDIYTGAYCLEHGANPNEFEYDLRNFGQNMLLKLLYRYRHTKRQDVIENVYKTIKLLINADIDLLWQDLNGLNVKDYVKIFGWSNTQIGTINEINSIPPNLECNIDMVKQHALFKNRDLDTDEIKCHLHDLLCGAQYVKTDTEIADVITSAKRILEVEKISNYTDLNRILNIMNSYGWSSTELSIYAKSCLVETPQFFYIC